MSQQLADHETLLFQLCVKEPKYTKELRSFRELEKADDFSL